MKNIYHSFLLLITIGSLTAQNLPKEVIVPAISDNPNLQFSVLNFDQTQADQFSILYYQQISGSIIHEGEFVPDTGGYVYKDQKLRELIPYSNFALYIKKQIVDVNGKQLATREYIFSARPLDQEGEFKLYFRKGYNHPQIENRKVLTHSIYNIQSLTEFSPAEMKALVEISRPYIPIKPGEVQTNNAPDRREQRESQLTSDLKQMKAQMKELRQMGVMGKGNIPDDEKLMTRNNLTPNRVFTVTKTKGTNCLLKFYVSEDMKTYDLLDTVRINGDVTILGSTPIYNTNNEIVGAYANFLYKFKDEKGEELSRQYTFVMDPDYNIQKWMYSVGKDKLNSLATEVCWYEGKDLLVIGSNREKIFKPYSVVHRFIAGGAAQQVYPTSEEEKGSDKTVYLKNYQPPVQFNSGQSLAPIADGKIPLYMCKAGDTRYLVMQGTKYDDAIKAKRYLSVEIYRVTGDGKLTNTFLLSDYNATVPFPMSQIVKNKGAEYFLLAYPIRVQIEFSPEKCEIFPLTADNSSLMPLMDNTLIQYTNYGALLLKRSTAGNQHTLLYYPQEH